MDDTGNSPAVGRRIIRRGRGGFAFSGGGVSNSSEGGSVNRRVEEIAEERIARQIEVVHRPHSDAPSDAPVGSSDEPELIAGTPSEEFNPRERMRQVRDRASDYEREYRFDLLHRLLIRKIPYDQIAAQLDISVSQVNRDVAELKKRLRKEAEGLDINEIIGDSKRFYDEAAAMSMRAASLSTVPMPIRLAAVRTGLAAKNDMHRFFQTAGVYDVLRFRPAEDGKGITDIQRLMENTERFLSGEAAAQLEFSDVAREVADSGDQEDIEL